MRTKLVIASLLVASTGAIGRTPEIFCPDITSDARRLHSCAYRVYALGPQVTTSPPQQSEPYQP